MRNLTRSIAAMSLMVPAYAYPLGIGEIKLHSALNQKLDAEIALQLSSGENFSDIRVKIAPPEKYDELGVPWNYFLSQIVFETAIDAQGRSIVKLKSKEPLREPFLDLVLEVAWDKGSLFREFTVLVDPPAAYDRPIVQVVSAPTEPKVETPESANVKESTPNLANEQYGPTTRLDTLWKITEKLNQDPEISTEQFLIALYNANQSAFYQPNVNALMADQFLTIPPKSDILQLSPGQALAEFRKQDSAWSPAASKSTVQKSIPDAEVNAQLELQAPLTDEVDQSKILVASDSAETTSSDQDFDQDDGLAVSDASLALQSRIEKLEEQLLMMQKILALKDAQIAALQAQTPLSNQNISEITGESVDDSGETNLAEEPKVVPNIDDKTETQANNAQAEVVKPVESKPKPEVKPEPKPKPKPVKPKPVVQEEPESGFLSDYLALVFGVTGTAILGVLGFYWWRRRSSKVDHEEDTESMFASASEISLPVIEEESSKGVSIPAFEDDSASYDVGTVGESSFLSEFTPSDFDAFDLDQNEVDPISEADVYLAYGRYQQAEDLMRQAITEQPERDECKLKLLEIFYANENQAGFEAYVKELISEGKNEDIAFWSKVTEMGRELGSDSNLFQAEAQASHQSADDSESEMGSASVEEMNTFAAEFNFDMESESLPEKSSSSVSDESEKDSDENHDLEFDLSIFDDVEEKQESQISTATESSSDVDLDEGLDFDLSAFDEKETSRSQAVNDVSSDQVESIDFDLDALALEPEATDEIQDEEPLAVEDDELGLESYDFELPSAEVDSVEDEIDTQMDVKAETPDSSDSDFDDFDFDFELELPSSMKESEQELGGSENHVSDLTDMDEIETKIDLARAYIDMGDSESAKGIIQEVLNNGNDKQKQTAQEILKQIN